MGRGCSPRFRSNAAMPAFIGVWGRLIPWIWGCSLIRGLGAAWTAVGHGGRVMLFSCVRGLRARPFFRDGFDVRLRESRTMRHSLIVSGSRLIPAGAGRGYLLVA